MQAKQNGTQRHQKKTENKTHKEAELKNFLQIALLEFRCWASGGIVSLSFVSVRFCPVWVHFSVLYFHFSVFNSIKRRRAEFSTHYWTWRLGPFSVLFFICLFFFFCLLCSQRNSLYSNVYNKINAICKAQWAKKSKLLGPLSRRVVLLHRKKSKIKASESFK